MIRGKKGDWSWETIGKIILTLAVLIGLLIAFGYFPKVWGAIKDIGDNLIGGAEKTFAEFDIGSLEKTLKEREASVKTLDNTKKEISKYLTENQCGLAEKEFKESAFRLVASRNVNPENVDSVLRDLKKDYPRIINCYMRARECENAYNLYKNVKDKVFDIKVSNDKEDMGNSLFDIAACYKDSLDEKASSEKFTEFINVFSETLKHPKKEAETILKELTKESMTSEEREGLKNAEDRIRRDYSDALSLYNLGKYKEALDAFDKMNSGANFREYSNYLSRSNTIRQYSVNSIYLKGKSAYKIAEADILPRGLDKCIALDNEHSLFLLNKIFWKEKFFDTGKLIVPTAFKETGDCFAGYLKTDPRSEESLNNAAKYYAALIKNFPKIEQSAEVLAELKPNCKDIQTLTSCHQTNERLATIMGEVLPEINFNLRCYWKTGIINFEAAGKCESCLDLLGKTCSNYGSREETCNANPCGFIPNCVYEKSFFYATCNAPK